MTETLPRSAIEPKNPLLNASRSSNLPHVPGIRVGDYIFLSGMGPIDPRAGHRPGTLIPKDFPCAASSASSPRAPSTS